MIGTILTDKDGNILNQVSAWQSTEPVKKLTHLIEQDYAIGYGLLNRSFEEFNDKTLIQRMNADKKSFNSYVEQPSDDPANDWRWNGVRPITRNKVITMAAHLVASTLIPGIFAQNDLDEEDKDAADVMRYLVQCLIRNSNYETAYRQVIIGALVNPIAYLHADYAEVLQTIKERAINGEITEKEVVDGILSGFQTYSIPPEEIMIANPRQYYLQRQKFIIRRRFIDYSELKKRYGNHKNWKHIQPGIKVFYDDAQGTFYEQYDPSLATLGEECIYFNRGEDLEVPYINGIYFGEENVRANPIKHRDSQNRPKYPYAKTGFSLIDEGKFFYYKSLVFHMADDQELDDRITRILVDSSVLESEPPLAGIGTGHMDSGFFYPGQLYPFKKDSSVTAIGTGRNLSNLHALLNNIEQQLDRDSISLTSEGQTTPGSKTKFEIQKAEMNATIQRGIFGRMIGDLVKDFGELMVDINLQHVTVGEAKELLTGEVELAFQTLLLPEQTEKGRKVTRKMVFDKSLIGKKFTKKQLKRMKISKVSKNGGLKSDVLTYNINPAVFRNLKFTMFVDLDVLLPRGQESKEVKAKEDYAIMRQDPLFNAKEVARDLAEVLKKGEADKYMNKEEISQEEIMGQKPKSESPKKVSVE